MWNHSVMNLPLVTIKWSHSIQTSRSYSQTRSHHHRPSVCDYEPLARKRILAYPKLRPYHQTCKTHHKSPRPLHYRLTQPKRRHVKWCCRPNSNTPSHQRHTSITPNTYFYISTYLQNSTNNLIFNP